jgi:hypothetical protein
MKAQCIVLWHEPSNMLAVADMRTGLPLLTVLDDEYEGINPYYSYPLSFLDWYGWRVLGEL